MFNNFSPQGFTAKACNNIIFLLNMFSIINRKLQKIHSCCAIRPLCHSLRIESPNKKMPVGKTQGKLSWYVCVLFVFVWYSWLDLFLELLGVKCCVLGCFGVKLLFRFLQQCFPWVFFIRYSMVLEFQILCCFCFYYHALMRFKLNMFLSSHSF